MSTILHFDPSKLTFAKAHSVRASQLNFQFQSVTYDGQSCLLQTKPFFGNGLINSKFQDQPQMLIPISSIPLLKVIDEKAKEVLDFPEDAPSSWKDSFISKEAYKSLNNDKLYLKTKDLQIYDIDGEIYDGELKQGTYSAILHVVGIYIGSHGSTDKRASLQVKVKQLQYEPQSNKCLFVKPTEITPSVKPTATAQVTFKQPLPKRRKPNSKDTLSVNIDGMYDKVDKTFIEECTDASFLWKFYLHCQAMVTKGHSNDETEHSIVNVEKQLMNLLGDDWLMHCRNQ